MERNRKTKVLSIIALVVAIVGMSLGFAAFSTTLSISSSASVTPSSSNFYVGFYGTEGASGTSSVTPTITGSATGSSISVSSGSTTASGLTANFTEPGQSVTYSFYVGNESEYDAYLRAINFLTVSGSSSNRVCTAGTDTSEDLVTAACEYISMSVDVNGTTATSTNDSISGNKLSKGTYIPITITLTYASDGARADGDFSVEFGGVSLDYSTVDSSVTLISFAFQGTTYQAEEGMTWAEWVNSEYNTAGIYVSEFGEVCTLGLEQVTNDPTEVIIDGTTITSVAPCLD